MKKFAKMLCALALTLSVVGCSSNKEEEITELQIQFVPTNVETADGTSAEFEAYMEKLLGMEVDVTVATDYNTIVEAMKSGKAHVGIMPPGTYAIGRKAGCATSILSSTLVDYDKETEQPIEGSKVGDFRAEVIVRADSGIKSYKDLEGKTVARLGATSLSGFVYPYVEMIEADVDVSKITFKENLSIPAAMADVYNGKIDACLVFEGARYVFKDLINDFEGNKVDVWTELDSFLGIYDIPNDAIAVLPSLDEELVAKIKQAFLDMAADEEGLRIMGSWGHTGYVESVEANYDPVAQFLDKAAEGV